jgi:hypothetical protein
MRKMSICLAAQIVCGAFCLGIAFAQTAVAQSGSTTSVSEAHGFDYLIGDWSVSYRKEKHPLSGSHEWILFSGTSRIRSLWTGVGDVEDGYFNTASGRRSHLTLRLFNQLTGKWALYLGSDSEVLPNPQIGNFSRDGSGKFYGLDSFNGKRILVLQVWSRLNGLPHFEQSFSVDDGKSWEKTWIADYTPAKH